MRIILTTTTLSTALFGTSGCFLDQETSDSPMSLATDASPIETTTTVNCKDHPRISLQASNGEPGLALCQYGFTVVPSYNSSTHRFIIGTNNHVYQDWRSSTGAASGWEDRGGFLISGVVAGTVAGGALRICAIGGNQDVYMKEYAPGSGWGGWRNVGANGDGCSSQFRPFAF